MAFAGFCSDPLAELLQRALRSAVRDDVLDLWQRRANAGHLRLRLVAAADHAQRRRALAREILDCDPARAPRAEASEPIGLDHGDELGPLGRKERDDERSPV